MTTSVLGGPGGVGGSPGITYSGGSPGGTSAIAGNTGTSGNAGYLFQFRL